MIADNDYAGDPDSLVALAHQVLSPKARTVLVTCPALNRTFPSSIPADRTAAIGAGIATELKPRIAARMKAVWIAFDDFLALLLLNAREQPRR